VKRITFERYSVKDVPTAATIEGIFAAPTVTRLA
jgi:hypothetical protein